VGCFILADEEPMINRKAGRVHMSLGTEAAAQFIVASLSRRSDDSLCAIYAWILMRSCRRSRARDDSRAQCDTRASRHRRSRPLALYPYLKAHPQRPLTPLFRE